MNINSCIAKWNLLSLYNVTCRFPGLTIWCWVMSWCVLPWGSLFLSFSKPQQTPWYNNPEGAGVSHTPWQKPADLLWDLAPAREKSLLVGET